MPKSLVSFMLGLLCLASAVPLLAACEQGPRVELLLEAKRTEAATPEAMEEARKVLVRRIAESGAWGATVARQGPDRFLVTLGDRADAEPVKALIGRSGRLEFRLVDLDVSPEQLRAGRSSPGIEILPTRDGGPVDRIAVQSRRIVTGSMIADARQEFDAAGQPAVTIRFDAVGTRRFADATRKNVGLPFAIVLDDEVISAPMVSEPILGGLAQINGAFTVEEAERMAIALRSGPLPIDLAVVEERVVEQ